MVVTVVAARTNRVSHALPVIGSDDLNGYLLSGDGQRPLCHWDLLGFVVEDRIGQSGDWLCLSFTKSQPHMIRHRY
jgi:hypothetical protein